MWWNILGRDLELGKTAQTQAHCDANAFNSRVVGIRADVTAQADYVIAILGQVNFFVGAYKSN